MPGAVRVSLFWRTFTLIAALVLASVATTLGLARLVERAPADQQLAWEVASVVNLTRSALVSSQGERRVALLAELARDEGVRVLPLEADDLIEPLPLDGSLRALPSRLKALLGPSTRLAGRVNGEPALWVSFDIDDDPFWIAMNPERLERRRGPGLATLAAIAAALALVGAVSLSGLINKPLRRLADAIERLARGEPGTPLPEDAPSEIADVNRRFNRMASDLAALEADRGIALAGISHDIRTPLTRLRMEIELSGLREEEKASMAAEIEGIDAIVRQFVEFARPAGGTGEAFDAAAVLRAAAARAAHSPGPALRVECTLPETLAWTGSATDLERIAANLLENARRYARRSDAEAPTLHIAAQRRDGAIVVDFDDDGPGIASAARARLLRPFQRAETARTEASGAGLGLAIVRRLAQRHGGDVALLDAPGGGLRVRVRLPAAAASDSRVQSSG